VHGRGAIVRITCIVSEMPEDAIICIVGEAPYDGLDALMCIMDEAPYDGLVCIVGEASRGWARVHRVPG